MPGELVDKLQEILAPEWFSTDSRRPVDKRDEREKSPILSEFIRTLGIADRKSSPSIISNLENRYIGLLELLGQDPIGKDQIPQIHDIITNHATGEGSKGALNSAHTKYLAEHKAPEQPVNFDDILQDLNALSNNKHLEEGIGPHNASEFRKEVSRINSEYNKTPQDNKSQVLANGLRGLSVWSQDKAESSKNPTWKKLGTVISCAFKVVGCRIKGDHKGAEENKLKMQQASKELSGKGKVFAANLKSTKETTKGFVDRIIKKSSEGQQR